MEQKITCYPDITVQERSSKDEVLILACDGLWDTVSSEESVDHLRQRVQSGVRDVKVLAESLRDYAYDRGRLMFFYL